MLLLLTLVAGVGVAGWLLWTRSDSAPVAQAYPDEALRELEADLNKEPITGTVNGLEADEAGEPTEAAEPDEETAEPAEAPGEVVSPTEDPEPAPTEQPELPEAEAKPAPKTKPAPKAAGPVVPTQNLPRDPAKASDVLVHRSLRLIRSGQLGTAEATLDRAWELDPKNPQAMAGYARLYIAKRDADKAVKWAKKAVRKRSRRAPYYVLLGDALELQGDSNGARKAWRKALSLDPDNKTAKARLSKSRARAAN